MVLTFDKISDLKKKLLEKYGVHLHAHDACGAQYFSFDSSVNDETVEFIREFVSEYSGSIKFSEKRDSFTIK